MLGGDADELTIVAETVGSGFEHGERFDVSLILRGVHAPGREGNYHVVTGVLRGLFDGGTAGEHDQGGQRDLFATRLGRVELALNLFESLQNLRQLGGLIDGPVLLRREANARTVRSSAFVGTAEGRRGRPRGR